MPHRLPRLVATDIDGTLLRSDGTLSDRTLAALSVAELAGAEVVLVTGRPPRWLGDVTSRTGQRGLAVCSNGALLVDMQAESFLRSQLLEPVRTAKLVSAVRGAVPEVAFAAEFGWWFAAEPEYEARDPHCVVDADEVAARPAAKLIAKHPSMDVDELLGTVGEAVGDLGTCTHSSITSRMVEISAPGVTKATMLAALCHDRGIDPADVVAFGDMPNDLAMLAWSGQPYAVGNAHPDVLAAVVDHAPSNDEDGVAATLTALFA
ncbi:MAG: HAD family hydrolase [Streptosporangiales bacterium]